MASVAGAALIGFFLVDLFDVALLESPGDQLNAGGIPAALLGTGLLLADVAVPVPASVIMISFGALFGFVPALLLSWAGGIGATMVGYWAGRAGRRTARPPQRVEHLLGRWGVVAVALTRPIPILAETVAVAAGTSRRLRGRHALAAAAVGGLPGAVLYSAAGSYAIGTVAGFLVVPLVIALTAAAWLIGRRLL